ncbi:hypothetical protein FACS189449_03340 [Alphaproteobacteria bacterium]|nr:hypothetical protein FACS189449_03340 [Alphaproteobacteria bacterium]
MKSSAEENSADQDDFSLMPDLLIAYEYSVDKLPAKVPSVGTFPKDLLKQMYFNLNRLEVLVKRGRCNDAVFSNPTTKLKNLVRIAVQNTRNARDDVFNSSIVEINRLKSAVGSYNVLSQETSKESPDILKIVPANSQDVVDDCYKRIVADTIDGARSSRKEKILIEELDKLFKRVSSYLKI